jgi:hypothetical protein
VGVLDFQRGLVADPTGIRIHNFVRRVTIPWAELQSIDPVPVSAEHHRLRFNDRITAGVPAGSSEPGQYLFNLRETLLSMQRAYSSKGVSPGQDHLPREVATPGTQDGAHHDPLREPEATSRSQAATHVQGGQSAAHMQDGRAVDNRQDAQDLFTPRDG